MARIVLDDKLLEVFTGSDGVAKLCNPAGKTVGHFVPAEFFRELLAHWANRQVSDEELEQASRHTESYSTEEVLEHLRGL